MPPLLTIWYDPLQLLLCCASIVANSFSLGQFRRSWVRLCITISRSEFGWSMALGAQPANFNQRPVKNSKSFVWAKWPSCTDISFKTSKIDTTRKIRFRILMSAWHWCSLLVVQYHCHKLREFLNQGVTYLDWQKLLLLIAYWRFSWISDNVKMTVWIFISLCKLS